MATLIKLVQGSAEWHAHRAQYRNASETAAVMGLSPWQTPYQLWALKTGRSQPTINPAMARGTALEPLARAAYETRTDQVMQPLVLLDGDYSASLDGMTFDGQLIVEIKVPMKGKASSLWQTVSRGQVPEHYGWQIEHQLMVSNAAQAHLYVYDGDSDSGLLLAIQPQPERWAAIHAAWDTFMGYVQHDTPPPLTDRDKRVRTDGDWVLASETYLQLKRKADALDAQLEDAKQALLQLATHASETGNGVTVTKFWKQGSVDYKRIPELGAVNLDDYRGQGRFETRITIGK